MLMFMLHVDVGGVGVDVDADVHNPTSLLEFAQSKSGITHFQ